MEPMDSQVTALASSDSDSVSVEGAGEDAADVQALRRLSDNLAAAFLCPDDFGFLADARVVAAPGAPELRVHRCVLCARSPFLRDFFARRAEGGGDKAVELREMLGDEVEVGHEALLLVIEYLYCGRVGDLPKAACACVDDDGCAHVGCRPAVAFMAQVLFAAYTFQVVELTNLFQVRLTLSHLPRAGRMPPWPSLRIGAFFFPLCLLLSSRCSMVLILAGLVSKMLIFNYCAR
jgi:regulatory protein NPR1